VKSLYVRAVCMSLLGAVMVAGCAGHNETSTNAVSENAAVSVELDSARDVAVRLADGSVYPVAGARTVLGTVKSQGADSLVLNVSTVRNDEGEEHFSTGVLSLPNESVKKLSVLNEHAKTTNVIGALLIPGSVALLFVACVLYFCPAT
jgi:hypothetical protein